MKILSYLIILFPVVSGTSPSDIADICYAKYDLEDKQSLLYYGERCRSLRKAVDCFDHGHTDSDIFLAMAYQDMFRRLQDLAAEACGFARVNYCSANVLDNKMRSCASQYGVMSMETLTPDYARRHYRALLSSLSCMEAAILICPDDEYLQSYIDGIHGWKKQLDKLTNSHSTEATRALVFFTPEEAYRAIRGLVCSPPVL